MAQEKTIRHSWPWPRKHGFTPGECDAQKAFMFSFSARHKEVNDQRCKVAMALAKPAPHDRLQGQENQQCSDCCTKRPTHVSLTSCLPAKSHAEESEQLPEAIKRLRSGPA